MQLIEILMPYLMGMLAMGAIWLIWGRRANDYLIIPLILVAIWVLISGIVFFDTLGTTADLEAFHNETLAAYEHTVDETRQIVLTDDALTDFSDQAASERIAELRDRVAWYNQLLARLGKFEALPLIGGIIADNDLEPIVLGGEESAK